MPTHTVVGTEASLVLSGYVSVGAWELECQRALVGLTVPTPGLSVLEIGYGLGMASTAIQTERTPALHTTVEANPTVARRAAGKIIGNQILLTACWQSVYNKLAKDSFDSIFFDPDPEIPADISWTASDVCNWVLPGVAKLTPLLRSGGRFGFLDFTNQVLLSTEFSVCARALGMAVESLQIPISPPSDCKYASSGYATAIVAVKNLNDEGDL